jgi:putative ABC transport system permease protein
MTALLWVFCGLFGAAAAAFFIPVLSNEKGRRSFFLALRSLWLHKLRSSLSVLGIIIGTGAVVALMAFGEGSMQDALDDIRRMGATNIIIQSVKPPDDSSGGQARGRAAIYGLTYDDYERFAMIPDVIRLVPMRIFPQEIRCRANAINNGRVVATTPEYAAVNPLEMLAGRFITEEDDHDMENVVVLASNTADRLFPYEDPLGNSIKLGRYNYRVIGVLKERARTSAGSGNKPADEFNNEVYIPLQTCKVRYGERIVYRQPGSMTAEQVQLSQVTLTVKDMDAVQRTADVVNSLLDQKHLKKDTAVTVPLDRLKEAERARDRYTMLLTVIAFISLVVGGIGIMNIMLATVTERTREIGIRRALGAKRRDITMQFLTEAVVQTSVGGIAGVLCGLSVVFGVPILWNLINNSPIPAKVNVASIFASVGVSIFVGIVAGLYPSWRAARLDPIEALRHE